MSQIFHGHFRPLYYPQNKSLVCVAAEWKKTPAQLSLPLRGGADVDHKSFLHRCQCGWNRFSIIAAYKSVR